MVRGGWEFVVWMPGGKKEGPKDLRIKCQPILCPKYDSCRAASTVHARLRTFERSQISSFERDSGRTPRYDNAWRRTRCFQCLQVNVSVHQGTEDQESHAITVDQESHAITVQESHAWPCNHSRSSGVMAPCVRRGHGLPSHACHHMQDSEIRKESFLGDACQPPRLDGRSV